MEMSHALIIFIFLSDLCGFFYRAKATFDDDKEKVFDLNHTKKNFTNKLFELRKEKKIFCSWS